ncbi:MAG: DUF222 domain-containing protein [Pseudonocardiaceae bacterium]
MFESRLLGEAFPPVALRDEDWFDPAWLDEMPCSDSPPEPQPPASACVPSGWLALELDHSSVDPARLSDAELIDSVVGFDRVSSWALARQARVLAEFARRRPGDHPLAARCDVPSLCSEFAPDEIGLALRLSRPAAATRLAMAQALAEQLPGTLDAWQAGMIDERKTRAISETSAVLPAELHGALEARVLPRAGTQTLTRLRASLARAVLALDPDGGNRRHEQRRKDRRVVVGPDGDGMASLWALLSAPDATAAYQRLGELARGLGTDDSRGMDARRADLLVDLLTGRRCAATGNCPAQDCNGDCECPTTESSAAAGTDSAPADIDRSSCRPTRAARPGKPLVSVIVPITTLMGLDDQPGELAGYGPIPATLAREIAADGIWRRLLTDPASGTLLDYGRSTYTPPAGLADFVRARDQYCRNPICGQRATTADLDHTMAWADGGTTSADNLYACCRRNHLVKTHVPGWHVEQHPDATITWTTPTGHTYTSHPHDYRFDPPPPSPRFGAQTPDPAADSADGAGHDPPEYDDPPF